MPFQLTLRDAIAHDIAGTWEQDGEEMMLDALDWIEAHPREWQVICDEVAFRMSTGRRFSLRNICDNVAWEYGVSVRHHLTAPFHRIISAQVEGFSDLCAHAKSKCDQTKGA